jgi:hypothetical protein
MTGISCLIIKLEALSHLPNISPALSLHNRCLLSLDHNTVLFGQQAWREAEQKSAGSFDFWKFFQIINDYKV